MTDNIESKINKEWITQAMGGVNLSMEEKIDEEILNEEAVILVQGTNMFGDPVYSYVKVAMRNFREFRKAMVSGDNFKPSDYGQVVSAGRGEPTQEIIDEMRITYGMVDLAQKVQEKTKARANANMPQPAFFNNDDYE